VSFPVSVVSFAGDSVVGFSGSRSVVPEFLASLFPLVSGEVFVGCAAGVDAVVRGAFPAARVFRVSGSGRWAFVARSVSFVRSLSAAGGVLFSFPSGACPAGVVPASRWVSGSSPSGSWSSLALALGLGVPCLVWLPSAVVPPASFGLCRSGFPFAGGCWWVSLPF
jgi:hypothetical protein